MSAVVPFPKLSETDRKTELYKWADRLLQELGLSDQIAQANSVEELRKITFDVNAPEVSFAILAALHPENGQRPAEHFVDIGKRMLQQILKARFAEAKRLRGQDLGRSGAATGGTSSSTSTTYDWTDDLKVDAKTGAILPLLANLILFLRYHKKWEGVFGFDEFANHVTIRKPPPWGSAAVDAPLTDQHESKTRVWFQSEDVKAAQGDIGRAIQTVARDNSYNPVREYFDALVWDGKPRIDDWLTTYLHTESTPYTHVVGPRYLISAVARIFKPGCKADHVLVLEGPQGAMKSELLCTLAIHEQWFIDRLSSVANKDAAMELAGAFIVEIAELDALIRATNSASKGFLGRRWDKFRPPYGKHTINQQRQCVFAGTINPPTTGYLTDPTGSRRIWPVTCVGMVDRDGIERDRDQLWAEAVVRFKAGATWWLETPELEKLATVEQAARFKRDLWHEPIEKWLGKRKEVGVAEVLKQALGIDPTGASRSAEMRVASILTNMGFVRCRPNKKDGDRRRKYRREIEKSVPKVRTKRPKQTQQEQTT